jgi:flagellar protein FliO/FliZ
LAESARPPALEERDRTAVEESVSMNILDSLFGAQVPLVAKMLFAFGVIFGLIALFWFVGRRFMPGPRVGVAGGRSRQPRLGVLDAHAVDARRKLVLIRRDNVEHLIMIGGPNDVVIESTILRARPQARTQGNGATAQPAPSLPADRIQPALVPAAEAARLADAEPRAVEADVRAMEVDMAAQLEEAFKRPAPQPAEPAPASANAARPAPPSAPPEPLRPARAEPAEPPRRVEPPYNVDRDEMEVDLFEEDAPALRGGQWEDEEDHRRDEQPVDRAPAAPPYRRDGAPRMREGVPSPREAAPQDEPVRAPDAPLPREPARAQAPAAPAPERATPSILELRIPELRLPELRLPEARRPAAPPPRAFDEDAMDGPPKSPVDEPRSTGRASPPPVIAVPQAGDATDRAPHEHGGFDRSGDQEVPPPPARSSQIPSFTPRLRRDPRLATVPQPAGGVSRPETEGAPPSPRPAAPVRPTAADPFASLEEEMASLLGRSPGSSNP